MFKSRISLIRKLALVGGALTVATAISGAAMAETTWKIGWTTPDAPSDPYAMTAHYLAEELENAAPGKFKLQNFSNHQLGDETEMLQGLQLGTLDAAVITGTFIGNIVPSFQLNDLPFLYGSYEQAHKVLDGKAGDIMFKQLTDKGIVGLGFAQAGFRHVINNIRPINTPEDLKGIKLRVQPSDIFLDSFRALGANPVPMAWSEVFTAVQQGTIDGLEIPIPVIYSSKMTEVNKYLSLTNHTYNALAVVVSKQSFNRLSSDEQQAVRNAARAAITRQRKTTSENEAQILQKIKDTGMQVNEVADLSLFRDRVSTIYDKYRKTIGSEVMDAALAQVKN
ncbi:TRAP transporter substrate-binding protein [Alcaligenaceae bacterium]|nr:TRAP transporter substrate-binding protein [Alcaligenaceae bacterium]